MIIGETLNIHFSKFENITVLQNFNVSVNEEAKKYFPTSYALSGLIKRLSCFKNHEKESYIDLMLAKRSRLLQITCVTEIKFTLEGYLQKL